MPLRIVFMGTPDFAVPTLLDIVGRGHDVVAVYTRAPKPAGRRGLDLTPSPVEREARRFGLPVLTPATLRTPEAAEAARAPWRRRRRRRRLSGLSCQSRSWRRCPRGAFNLHASLLPRWRGAAPINRAIMAGDAETGVMVMRMEEGLDTGPIALAERVPIGPDETAGDLHDRLARLGADLMVRALGALERDTLRLTPQPAHGITYAGKIGKDETRIAWTRPWKEVHDHIRGLSPFPGAWFEIAGDAHQGAARDQRPRYWHARHGARRQADRRLRGGRRAHPRIATGRPPGDEGRRIPARHAGCRRRPVWIAKPRIANSWLVMPRYKLTIEYDGRPFVGWQIQDNGPSVQGALAEAVEAFCGESVSVSGAGRTDAGVHALGQVGHVDLAKSWDEETVRDALNAHLRPHPVAVISAERVESTFDARFSAIKRHYLYRIINRRADLTFERGRAWRIAKPLNSTAMQAAAQRFVGPHDFTTFRSVECQAKSPVKTLDQLDVRRIRDDIHIVAAARSFLHTQVRSMVGALVLVGEGKWTPTIFPRRSRRAIAPPARRSRRPTDFI